MKITNLSVHLVAVGFRNAIITEIETDAGIVGISETVMKRRSKTIVQYIQELGRYLIGKDPGRIEDHYEKLYRDSFWVGGPMHSTAISAVEIALWDIVGKELGVPIYRLFGGPTREQIQVYCHSSCGANPDEGAENALKALENGFRVMKTTLPVFYGLKGSPSGYSGTVGRIEATHKETEFLSPRILAEIRRHFEVVRDAVGREMDISIDLHGRLSPANAVRLAESLADLNLLFIEEPVPPENVDAMAWVSRRSPVPIAAGERIATIYGARELLEKQAVAIFQPDVVNCGGLSQAKKMAAMAEAHYITVAPHNPNGPLATLASAHLAASIPNFYLLEMIGSPADLAVFNELIDPPLVVQDGFLELPQDPGLGVNLRRNNFDRYPYQAFEGTR